MKYLSTEHLLNFCKQFPVKLLNFLEAAFQLSLFLLTKYLHQIKRNGINRTTYLIYLTL